MKTKKIRVLVVDDSALMRKIISDIVCKQDDMELAGTAYDGENALKKIKLLSPDVVTMDLEMPKLDGISTLKTIMARDPLPVIIISSYTQRGSEKTMEALIHGAVDFVAKPLTGIGDTIEELKKVLPAKIRGASGARLYSGRLRYPGAIPRKKRGDKQEAEVVVAIGASTGGPRAIEEILKELPADLPAATLITQHMPAGFTASLAQRLDRISNLAVKEAQEGDLLLEGEVLIAPGGFHLKVKDRKIVIDSGCKVNHVRPAVDVMFESLVWLPLPVVAVVLTGMGHDGKKGVQLLKNNKKEKVIVMAQDPLTSVVKGMPEAVIKTGHCDSIEQLSAMSTQIVNQVYSLKRNNCKTDTLSDLE
ncbi:MAG: chemotaxis response regulator protein-glutamate methylesterase [Firmicutes bacterium]|jgi:two-component system chemotaxis response regulator CheB|nr:chemotaxis response regulator protein-glutamate methylesterase [Bacillota bacterium]